MKRIGFCIFAALVALAVYGFVAGGRPTDPPVRITEFAIEGDDVRITWECVNSNSYSLQASACVTGTYSTVASIAITNDTLTVTNLVEIGGATNSPSRFYGISHPEPPPL